jgi:hypothetical protein
VQWHVVWAWTSASYSRIIASGPEPILVAAMLFSGTTGTRWQLKDGADAATATAC